MYVKHVCQGIDQPFRRLPCYEYQGKSEVTYRLIYGGLYGGVPFVHEIGSLSLQQKLFSEVRAHLQLVGREGGERKVGGEEGRGEEGRGEEGRGEGGRGEGMKGGERGGREGRGEEGREEGMKGGEEGRGGREGRKGGKRG